MKARVFCSAEFGDMGTLEQQLTTLLAAGVPFTETRIVTVAKPNGFGYYHPRYRLQWTEAAQPVIGPDPRD